MKCFTPLFLKPAKLFLCFVILPFLLFYSSCKKKADEFITIDPAFQSYISAFTSGIISKESSIRIRLAQENASFTESGQEFGMGDLFSFSPNISGKSYWVDNRTIEFIPEKNFISGQLYTCTFQLNKVCDVKEDKLKEFIFQFQIIRQYFNVETYTHKTYVKTDLKRNKIPGLLTTADVATPDEVEKILQASQQLKNLSITWQHESDRKLHYFEIENVIRKETPEKVLLKWNGKDLGLEITGESEIEIPALGDFKVMDVKVVQQPEQHIQIDFSDPLDEQQDLEGLVQIKNNTQFRFIIDNNTLKAFPVIRQTGTTTLTVHKGIKNILFYKMPKTFSQEIIFEEIKPAVRLVGEGVIIPSSNGLIFPFEAVNLSAVDVSVVQIYEDNIAQFLQVNELDGNYEMKRVGRQILKTTIKLGTDKPLDLGKWNTFSFDLAKLMQTNPGAIYRIELSFKKAYSLYACQHTETSAGENESNELSDNWDENDEKDQSNWDYTEDYYSDYYDDYYYYDDYSWQERDNPCSKSYYTKNKNVSRNILASNLGIIAKGFGKNSFQFYVNDMLTAQPMQGVILEVLNYQQQVLAKGTTNSNGMVQITTEAKPFLLIAKKDSQRGYLRLNEGQALSTSSFDVSGNTIEKGLKGFIYGERGVWRPGDSLFLSFMLEDENNILPKNHPVILELINPKGQLNSRIVKTSGLNGVYDFRTATEEDAPTGNWSAKIKVGGTTFQKTLKIETIKPNRLKININFGTEVLSASNSTLKGNMQVNWLHGAVAKNLKTQINASLSTTKTTFKKYEDYNFDDPTKSFYSEEFSLFEGKIDAEGKASFSSNMGTQESAPGMLKANFITRVFEEGGDFSIDRFSIPYSPYDTYVGIKSPKGDKARGMLLTDTNHIISVVTLNEFGEPVSRNNLEVEVYKVEWRWWWDATAESNLASYVGNSYHQPIFRKTISTVNGKGNFIFRINYPDWGRYLIRIYDPQGKHSTAKTVYADWPGWAGRAQKDNPAGASLLSFSANKEKYKVGETATITVPSPAKGKILLSIENGSKIIDSWWNDAQQGETKLSFKITEEMCPNVYVHVTLLQPHGQTTNDLPIRMYGIIPLFADNPETILQPEIIAPPVLVPEEIATVSVKEKNGKPMTYTLAIVDEGLLDLTRFKTPDPWQHFYAREALGVKTWDMYDYVMGAYGGKIEQIFGLGGDGEINPAKDGKKVHRFKPMVRFIGPFKLEKGKTNKHPIDIPQYVGSVRIMVVAKEYDAYGNAEKTVPVRKPLMLLATLPRVVGPNEMVKLPVSVFAMEKNIKNVTIDVETNSLFTVDGSKNKSLVFSNTGDEMISFDLKVANKTGKGKVKINAKSGNEKATYEIEIEVRNPNAEITDFIEAAIEPGKTWEGEFLPPGMPGTNKATLEVSSIPAIDLSRRLKFLISYPHGCVEQTTSSAFPQLFLSDVMEINAETKQRISENIKSAINRLRSFQLNNGGLAYWSGNSEVDDWGTSYAGHFMLEAEAKGYNLPLGFKENWLKYQKNAARNWSENKKKNIHTDYLLQAYRLYTLSLAKQPEMGAMNRMREITNLPITAKWRLAAAYAISGQTEAAQKLVANTGTEIKPYSESEYSYGSAERDYAMILETMILLNQKASTFKLLKIVSAALSSEKWMSTQSTAYSLIAVSKLAGKSDKKGLSFTYSINSGNETNAQTQLAVSQIAIDVKGKKQGLIKISNTGKSTIFARIVMSGIPEAGSENAFESNLKTEVVFKSMKGEMIDVNSLEQGTDFMAEVTVTNNGILGNYKNLALSQIFPSGWEIRNMRMDGTDNLYKEDEYDYRDLRDDRVYTYFSLNKNQKKTFKVILNASYLGKFYMPGMVCEAMYEHTVQSRKKGSWVTVYTPENTLSNK
ncbi:Alpha-2-macroglobulin [Flavobacteriales bacterium]|nr:hypothetical protein [Flavobacteriales bacterium]MCL4816766.1 hypothetical protein [Flavobacteriales bacterium]WKZ74093.1 MAG: MG2 domain-containing protein [Vicingaceae bacterium]CAG0991631.1 Alpha-2-macroglobulin [Flavobacteriales bacterium]